MVVDNTSCHNQLESVFSEPEFLEHTLLHLSPYSPMLNTSKNFWIYTKSFIKRELTGNSESLLTGDRDKLSICRFRARGLSSFDEEALSTVTAEI